MFSLPLVMRLGDGAGGPGSTVPTSNSLIGRPGRVGQVVRQLDIGLEWLTVPAGNVRVGATMRAGVGVDYELLTEPMLPQGNNWSPGEWDNGPGIVTWLEADDLALGPVSRWDDHRYWAGSAYQPAVQAVVPNEPTVSNTWRGEKWVDFGGGTPQWLQFGANVATALTAAVGYGAAFFVALVRTWVIGSGNNEVFQSLGGTNAVFAGMNGGQILSNWQFGSAVAEMQRRGVAALGGALQPGYGGAQNSVVVAFSYDSTDIGVYIDGLFYKVPHGLVGGFAAGTWYLGATGGHQFFGSVRRAIVAKGTPTLADLLKFDAYMRKERVRPVIVDSNSIGANASAGPANNSWPFYVEGALSSRYAFENRSIGGQATTDILARWETETRHRVTPGSVAVMSEIGNHISFGATIGDAQAAVRQYIALVTEANAIPFIVTPMKRTLFSPAQETIRAAISADLKANWASYGLMCAAQVIPFDDVPEAQNPADPVYFPDGVHPSTALHQLLAPVAATRIQTVAPV